MAMHDRMRNMVIRRLGVGKGGQGVLLKLTKTIPGVYNPKKGKVDPPTITEYEGTGVRVNYSDYAHRDDTIQYGDFQIYISPMKYDWSGDLPKPAIGDRILFNNEECSVIKVSPFNENTVSCGWKVQVRVG